MIDTRKMEGQRILYGSVLLENFGEDKFKALAEERKQLLNHIKWEGSVLLTVAKTKGEIQSIYVSNTDGTISSTEFPQVSAFLEALSEFKYKDDFEQHCTIEFTMDNALTKITNIKVSAVKNNKSKPMCTLSGEKIKLKQDKKANGFFEDNYYYIFSKDVPKDALVYFTLNFILKASIEKYGNVETNFKGVQEV